MAYLENFNAVYKNLNFQQKSLQCGVLGIAKFEIAYEMRSTKTVTQVNFTNKTDHSVHFINQTDDLIRINR